MPVSEFSAGVSVVGVSGAAVTVTLPAVTGRTHVIGMLEITLYAAAAIAGAAAPITVTTTNLPGNPSFTFPTAMLIGTVARAGLPPGAGPVIAVAAGTPTTIVCPAVTGAIWRVNVFYQPYG